ncbi:MAG: hypothetical protein R2682_00935 [Pyrinomonadaceae bacterium]
MPTDAGAELEAFFDSSGKYSAREETIVSVSGCLSTQRKWQEFDAAWQATLSSEGFQQDVKTSRYIFHASPFHSGNCRYMPKSVSVTARQRIYKKLLFLIREHILFKVSCAVRLSDYNQIIRDFPHSDEGLLSSPGEYAFRLCIALATSWAYKNGFDPWLNCVIDRNEYYWGKLLLRYLKTRKAYPNKLALRSLNDGNKAQFSGLQAADVLAWESRKYFLSNNPAQIDKNTDLPHPEWQIISNVQDDTEIHLFTYSKMYEHLSGLLESTLNEHPDKSKLIDEGRLCDTRDDLLRGVLAKLHEKREEKKYADLAKWRARKSPSKGKY